MADAKLALRAILDAVKDRVGPGSGGLKEEVVAEIKQAKDKQKSEWADIVNDTSAPTTGYRVVSELSKIIDPDKTIALHDAGGSRGYMSPFWEATKPRSYVGMGGMAAMGWSLGGAIGAKLGRPDDLVVHLLGDASFGMVGMELETAVRMGISTLTIVVNNEGTGGGLMGMNGPSGPPPDMAKLTGNWSKVAEGLGAWTERVEDPLDVGPALRRAIAATEGGQAALLEIMIKPMAMPNTPDDWSL